MNKIKHINDFTSIEIMNIAFLSIGGNINDRLQNLKLCLELVKMNCGSIENKSNIYESKAWGVNSKNKYLNQTIKLLTPLSPKELLNSIQSIELKMGRQRTENQYSDRIIDIDILAFNNQIIDEVDLKVPHPRLHLRKFVLVPLIEIEPNWEHPISLHKISKLMSLCKDTSEILIYKE